MSNANIAGASLSSYEKARKYNLFSFANAPHKDYKPFFVDHEGLNIKMTDVLQIILIVLILGLLAFVILRSMRQAQVEEPEPEISIDDILQSTQPEAELDEIGVEDKSEARKIVEKFVEDNPEAAANLLRNWLNDDWS